MLKVVGITELQHESLEASGYTLSLRLNNLYREYGSYWRTGNFHDALVEIGLNDNNHSIKNMNIVIVPKRYIVQTEILNAGHLPVESGVPICEWTYDKPSPSYVDEMLNFRMFISENSISIWLGEEANLKKFILAERVKFGVDAENYLRAIQVADIQPSEMATIRLAFLSSSGEGVIHKRSANVLGKWLKMFRKSL